MEFDRVIVGALRTNCYILKSGNSGIIVDPGDEADRIIEKAKGLGIELILLTHGHPDHTGALREVKEETGAQVAVHPLDGKEHCEIELKDGQVIEFRKERIKVIHTPGHTPGSYCFLAGDVLFSGA